MSLIRYALPVAAAALALAACNNTSVVTAEPEQPAPGADETRRANAVYVLNAALRASSSAPRFEGGGITQSTNIDTMFVTADHARVEFADGNPGLTIELGAGRDPLTLTEAHRVPVVPGVPVEDEKPVPSELLDGVTAQTMAYSRLLSDSRLLSATLSTGWSREDRSDWTAVGVWLYMTGNFADGHIGWAETGVFADGPELRTAPDPMPMEGTATYRGMAAGSFFTRYGTDFSDSTAPFYRAPGSVEFGAFEGATELEADFGGETPTISGCVGCGDDVPVSLRYVTFVDGETGEQAYSLSGPSGVEIELGAAAIQSDGTFRSYDVTVRNPRFEAVVGETPVAGRISSWGGRFSNILDADGDPRLAAGTFGGHSRAIGGSESSFLGSFMAPKR